MMIISNKQQSPLKEPKRTKRVVKEWSEWTDPLSASEGRESDLYHHLPWAASVRTSRASEHNNRLFLNCRT